MTKPTDTRKLSDGRDAKGKFAVGNPGGPGRRPGRGPAAELRAALGTDLPAIIDKVRSAALAGDMQAVRIILDRVAPPLRAEELPTTLELPQGTLTAKGHAILTAAANGDISPSQAASMISALGALARVAEMDELEARVAALEARTVGGA